MESLISVIVPIYKVEAYLDECVQSILSQTHKLLEIILVDDGSPDGCPAMCDAWAQKDARIRVIHKSNGGLSDARNAGLEIATGEYIAFVDSDDWIEPQMYEKMLAALQRENADICACAIKQCYPERTEVFGAHAVVGGSSRILGMLYDDTAYPVSAWNKLYCRHCFETLRFPVGKICEDAFTTYLLVDQAEKIVQIPEAFYCYRIRPQSIMTSSFSHKKMDEEEAWRSNYEFVWEHYPEHKKKAFDFYLQRVNGLIHAIPKEQRAEFSTEYEKLHGILCRNFCYILFGSSMRWKYRVKFLLEYIQL